MPVLRAWRKTWRALGWLSLLTAATASAQVVEPASLSTADRDRAFQELAEQASVFEQQGMFLRRLIRLATPSVVHIDAENGPSDGGARRGGEEAGSGVIIQLHEKEYVVTNRHVIDEAPLSQIHIRLDDGRVLRPTNKWEDQETDIALLAITAKNLVPARVGDSDQVDIGDFVLAVGSPFGLSHTVTFGMLSAKGRRDLDLGDGNIRYQDFLQTDAAINPGNSGGPLLNLRGEVIGINTAIASSSGGSEGIGFSIPSNMIITVAKQFIEHGRVLRAYLGVGLTDEFTPEQAVRLGLPRPQGAHVREVHAGSPAAKAGIQVNDVILEVEGQRVEDDEHLIKIIGFAEVDHTANIVVLRQGKSVTTRVKLTDRNGGQ